MTTPSTFNVERAYTQSDLDTLLAKMGCGHLRAEWVDDLVQTDERGDIANRIRGHCASCQLLAKLVQVVVERHRELLERADWLLEIVRNECVQIEKNGHLWCDHCSGDKFHAPDCKFAATSVALSAAKKLSSPENLAAMIAEARKEPPSK